MPALVSYVPDGASMHGKHYKLVVNGKQIGTAIASASTARSGFHSVRGTVYSATAMGQEFRGSRATVIKQIERAMGAGPIGGKWCE